MKNRKQIKAYKTASGKCPFQEWHKGIKNETIRAAIVERVDRVAGNNLGDCVSVGDAVFEIRLHSGPGYRIYFAYDGDAILLLLIGGDKSSQDKDIKQAKKYLTDYERRKKQ